MAENKTRGATKALVTTREPTLSASRGARRPVCGPIDRKEARERLASNDEPATSAPLRNALEMGPLDLLAYQGDVLELTILFFDTLRRRAGGSFGP